MINPMTPSGIETATPRFHTILPQQRTRVGNVTYGIRFQYYVTIPHSTIQFKEKKNCTHGRCSVSIHLPVYSRQLAECWLDTSGSFRCPPWSAQMLPCL